MKNATCPINQAIFDVDFEMRDPRYASFLIHCAQSDFYEAITFTQKVLPFTLNAFALTENHMRILWTLPHCNDDTEIRYKMLWAMYEKALKKRGVQFIAANDSFNHCLYSSAKVQREAEFEKRRKAIQRLPNLFEFKLPTGIPQDAA